MEAYKAANIEGGKEIEATFLFRGVTVLTCI